ncbi:hypothetical protein N7528_002369 [Penicillium herquei]|nr:hypothetical protein N7528_002369 [Penicillium herquei]
MSRRATPGQAAQNQQTIKALLKLETNKICADCKRNKHPRWASWNLGIFICIRCSGIHRGMGTHISRVKSVDLDAWTDEQLQSVIKWGNGKANKYWEAKLAPGHVPSDAKIENFIRTKYESKRWVMDGPMPDPSTLGDDDDVPLAVVQEKAKIERSASQRAAPSQAPVRRPQPSIDLFGDDISPPVRPSTTEPASRAPPKPSQPIQQPKAQKPGDSLLGLDFFGSTQPAAANRPASTSSTPAAPSGMSRPDLKQSILSLYSKPQPAPVQHERNNSFGDMAAPAWTKLPHYYSPPLPKPAEKPSPFANLTSFSTTKSTPAAPKVTSPSGSASGGFFDSMTSPTLSAPKQQSRNASISSNSQDFGFGGPSFQPQAPPKPQAPAATMAAAGIMDPWGGNAWSTPDPAPAHVPAPAAPAASMMKVPDTLTANDFGGGWGAPSAASKPAPAVAEDEDFGGWTSAAPVSSGPTITSNNSTKPAGGFGGADDLFSNVWE